MATLQTGSSALRTLPQLRPINVSDFRSGIPEMQAAERGVYQNLQEQERMRAARRSGAIEAATQDERLALAELTAAEALDLYPQQANVRALEAAGAINEATEALETYPAMRRTREAQTQAGRVGAITAAEEARLRQREIQAALPMVESVTREQQAARAAQARAQQAQAAQNVMRAENAVQREQMIDPISGALVEEEFVIVDDNGVPRRRVFQTREIATAEQLASQRQLQGAQVQAQQALATQRMQPRTARPTTQLLRQTDPLTGQTAVVGTISTYYDPESGGYMRQRFDANDNPVGDPFPLGGPGTQPNSPVAPATPTAAPPPASPVAPTTGGQPLPQPTPASIARLRGNPALAPQFDAIFGAGAAQRILSQQ